MQQPIDVPALEQYISHHVPVIVPPLSIEQFTFGNSNPTYCLTDSKQHKYVLRKKPPGKILNAAAHQIEREARVLRALAGTDVPVPEVYCFCEDANVIGTPFYVMEFLDGRIFKEAHLPECSDWERSEMWRAAAETLAKLHRIDPSSIGLANFGKPRGFYSRQVRTLQRLGESYAPVVDIESKVPVGKLPHMVELLAFFGDEKSQPEDRGSIVHGDYKIDNLVYHKTEPRIIGILDWEISTIGHPLSDLTNLILPWTVTNIAVSPAIKVHSHPAFRTDSTSFPGLPTKSQAVAHYTALASYDPRPALPWADAFMVFRTAVMLQGIAARYATRQSRGYDAFELGEDREPYVRAAWEMVRELGLTRGRGGNGQDDGVGGMEDKGTGERKARL